MHTNNPTEDHNTNNEDQSTICKVHHYRLYSSFNQHGTERQFQDSVSMLFQLAQLLFQVCNSSPHISGKAQFHKIIYATNFQLQKF